MKKTSRSGGLSQVPVLLAVDVDLPNGERGLAGHTKWMSRADADGCEMRRLGTIQAPCSILKPCHGPSGGALYVESPIVAMPFAYAEHLEAEGAVKILRDDRMIAIHKGAWALAAEKQKEAIRTARQMTIDAQAAAKRASSLTAFRPTIDWGADPAPAVVAPELPSEAA